MWGFCPTPESYPGKKRVIDNVQVEHNVRLEAALESAEAAERKIVSTAVELEAARAQLQATYARAQVLPQGPSMIPRGNFE